MPVWLLESQLATLEALQHDEAALGVEVSSSVERIVAQPLAVLPNCRTTPLGSQPI